ncbi:putative chitin synthase [Talaromyces proteolyticus]|uniref:chitin synthase n=1 Tax=Talaromyces proteolyticus TaxID=1131652 RepID=A0AAD4Q6B4_9EURO|nr:putative chitin synthase [Talaromyces proteolyticus]KAH8705177.1 putative chitin synthase [Talaromyces proteolyticus]
MTNRFSVFSMTSGPGGAKSSSQVSTTSLLNALHTSYTSGQPYQLETGTSLVVNTWLTAVNTNPDGSSGGTVDAELARRAWEHCRRRAEDSCIVLGSLHRSTPCLLPALLSAVPLSTPDVLYSAINAIRPFVSAVTPFNPSYSLYSSFAISYTFTLTGNITGLTLALSSSGINVTRGLLDVPAEPGYRAFDVFYYLLNAASSNAERDYLALKDPSAYAILSKSGTYNPPSFLPTADDAAAAEDFRSALKAIGIKGAAQRGLISVLAGLLKLGNTLGFLVDQEDLEEVCEEAAELLGVDPEILLHNCTTDDRQVFVSGVYEALVDWVIQKANEAIANQLRNDQENTSSDGSGPQWNNDDNSDTVTLTIIDIPSPPLGKAVALRGIFDDNVGINAEMKEDGLEFASPGQSVLNEMNTAVAEVEGDFGITGGAAFRERSLFLDKRQTVLEKVGVEVEMGAFLRDLLFPVESQGITLGKRGRFDLPTTLGSSRVWYHLAVHPTDDTPDSMAALPTVTSAWSAGAVSRQLRDWRLPEWANRRHKQLDFTADFDVEEFVTRYSRLGCKEGKDGVESWVLERGWSNGDVIVGHERIWMREGAWWEAETMLDLKPDGNPFMVVNPFETGYSATPPNPNGSGFFPPVPIADSGSFVASRDNLLNINRQSTMSPGLARSIGPGQTLHSFGAAGDYGLGPKGDDHKADDAYYEAELNRLAGNDPEYGNPNHIEKKPITFGRRLWAGFVWAVTFWIPSFMLRYIGRMKRPDVRMAWREKLVLVLLILLFNGIVVFYIIEFGNLLCPNKDKVWNPQELSYHTGDNDFYVSVAGKVYDISKFWRLQHSDTAIQTSSANMQWAAGQILDPYFPVPLTEACGMFVTDTSVVLSNNNTAATEQSEAIHWSGNFKQPVQKSALYKFSWYDQQFLPFLQQYYKGNLVYTRGNISDQANSDQRYWVIINNGVYDLTNYFYSLGLEDGRDSYNFLPSAVTTLVKQNAGSDISSKWQDSANFTNALTCMKHAFYVGEVDFRDTPKCTVNNWILLSFTILIGAVILVKFLAALQLGTKRRPAPQDKFVICQVPAYTEGEDQLRKGLDSLTALQYDNKRKLICVICDGMIVGGGNDRPTPKIVLDILGVDPKIDPPALPFKSVGEGSDQLNYGKVYSGLYEFEGNVVPYVVIVKVGKESEQAKSKPGNRGKRDSQVLILNFLNRVHHRAPMSPLELEIFHQINNVIGVDPELYEYVFMVDADTSVREDSLNRLVAACATDAKIAGICGETSLQNEERSWWTMIQVYEYYISHHLAKAFESLFGSVTCLPGCFCMYRLRTADKGRPLIISDKVLKEYSDGDIDTLHKKNLLALGEDRFLTTLMTKHFPTMSYKFIPDAYASTAAPETWGVLLSQRRRWINSTVHNLVELAALKDLCGFCCFSMRFVVLVDLLGTIILPATCVYLGYMIYLMASHTGPFPLISMAILAGVYGLQAIIFLIKRQWQHIGWMIIYLCAFPIYSFVLPLYSFWKQDDFTWGNTRVVIGEKGDRRVVAVKDEPFDPRSIPLQRWDDYALANNLPGRRGQAEAGDEKNYPGVYADEVALEMDDLHSTYSSVKPTSTILTSFPSGRGPYMPPQSPAPFGGNNRNSRMSSFTRYTDAPQPGTQGQRHVSMGGLSNYQDNPMNTSRLSMPMMQSSDNLLGAPHRQRSPMGGYGSRPVSTAMDFRGVPGHGPDDSTIIDAIRQVLGEVDLDNITKKQGVYPPPA